VRCRAATRCLARTPTVSHTAVPELHTFQRRRGSSSTYCLCARSIPTRSAQAARTSAIGRSEFTYRYKYKYTVQVQVHLYCTSGCGKYGKHVTSCRTPRQHPLDLVFFLLFLCIAHSQHEPATHSYKAPAHCLPLHRD
jgi:hypothetical protein